MKTIVLSGELGDRFGREWRLDVATPAEAIRAISVNAPGFLTHLIDSEKRGVGYRVIIGDRDAAAADIPLPFSRSETLHIVPVIAGSKDGFGTILFGAALIGLSFIPGLQAPLFTLAGASTSIASIAASIGVSLVLGGVAQMLVGTPKAQTSQAVDQKDSYYFNGPVNTTVQGVPVPVGYGELIVGSHVISSGLSAENMI